VPVIKVTANPRTAQHLAEHIDCFIDIFGDARVEDLGGQIHDEMLKVASGRLTKAEVLNYGAYPDIWTRGSVF